MQPLIDKNFLWLGLSAALFTSCAIDEAPPGPLDETRAVAATASGCTEQSENHSDPNTGQSWTSVWYCGNQAGAAMYLGANDSTPVADMDSTTSWFVCYRRGETHAGGNNVWYYSQGDRSVAGWSGRQAWGYIPAVNVWTTTDPAPEIPECDPDMWQSKLSISDPNTGTSWSTVWTGGNIGGTPLYKDANTNTPIGYLDSTTSWFTCQIQGATVSGGDIWYYTQGNRTIADWESRQAWGFIPAVKMLTRNNPYDGVPACSFGGGGTCSNPTAPALFPVRGLHKTGIFNDTPSHNPSLWTCGKANSKSDFNPPAHVGIDILAAEGTPVVATVAGIVRQAELSSYSGNQVAVVDACGWTHYSIHLHHIASGITTGVKVSASTIIGYVGHTGTASNGVTHLHHSIYPGLPGNNDRYDEGVDPHPYVLAVERNVCDRVFPYVSRDVR
jgi:hypothetical protein